MFRIICLLAVVSLCACGCATTHTAVITIEQPAGVKRSPVLRAEFRLAGN